jgi:hypothetical protein
VSRVGGENIVVLFVNDEVIESLAGWARQVNARDPPQRFRESTIGKAPGMMRRLLDRHASS